jgi:hypothetical protein
VNRRQRAARFGRAWYGDPELEPTEPGHLFWAPLGPEHQRRRRGRGRRIRRAAERAAAGSGGWTEIGYTTEGVLDETSPYRQRTTTGPGRLAWKPLHGISGVTFGSDPDSDDDALAELGRTVWTAPATQTVSFEVRLDPETVARFAEARRWAAQVRGLIERGLQLELTPWQEQVLAWYAPCCPYHTDSCDPSRKPGTDVCCTRCPTLTA